MIRLLSALLFILLLVALTFAQHLLPTDYANPFILTQTPLGQPTYLPILATVIKVLFSAYLALLVAVVFGLPNRELSTRDVLLHDGRTLAVFILTFCLSSFIAPAKHLDTKDAKHLPAKESQTSVLEGYVIDSVTREPVPDVTLNIMDWDTVDSKTPTCMSDHAGRFRFKDLKPGPSLQQVRLHAQKVGYEISTNDPPLGTTSLPIPLRPKQTDSK